MKTVLYISNQGGGAPKSLMNMIRSLAGEVYPIVLFENDWYDYRTFREAGIECLIVPFRMNMVLDEPSYKTLRWRLHRWLDEWRMNRRAAARVARLLQGRHIDIVHCNTGAITIGNEVARALHARFVWHIREFQDVDFGGFPYHGWADFYRRMASADAVIGITKAIASHFHFEQLPQAEVIWNGIRSEKDACYQPEKEDYILYCSGLIVAGKGLHDLLEAYAHSELPQRGIRLKVVGLMDESYRPRIESLLDKYNLRPFVSMEGTQSEVRPYFERARAFVLPSLNEGLGRVVIESMFYGCPVIARNAGGPTEYITSGENGYLFDNCQQLSAMLNEVCSQSQEQLILRAQKMVKEHFSEETYGQKILSLYNRLTEPKE